MGLRRLSKVFSGWATLAILPYVAPFQIQPSPDLALHGPIYLPATNGSSQAFVDAKAEAKSAIEGIIAAGNSSFGLFDNLTTSFSLSVFRLADDEPLFEYHFDAPGLNGSLTRSELTEDTIYRAGSIGKMMTVYTFLVDIGDEIFTHPVTKYLPELEEAQKSFNNSVWSTNWDEVTIGSLAAQLSGIGRDFRWGDYALESYANPPVEEVRSWGFPPVDDDTTMNCNFWGPQPDCSRAQTLESLINHPPAFPSYQRAAYSDLAYMVLGLVYQNITGRSIDDGQMEVFKDRLGMASTYARPPAQGVDAIIPYNESVAHFYHDFGIMSPAGGQYMSTRDFRTWGRAILNSTLLDRAMTDRWLKPVALTSQWTTAVGAPFEIYRMQFPANSMIGSERIIDTYCKQGDVEMYSTYFAVVPDLEIGMTVLAAGEYPNRQIAPVRNTAVEIFYRAADAAAKEQAGQAFTGRYEATGLNSSISLVVDGGPGVWISEWISNGADFLASPLLKSFGDLRLYPAGLTTKGDDGITYRAYRFQGFRNGGERRQGDWWSEYNDWWLQVDYVLYDNKGVDSFVIGFDQAGVVQSVLPVALGVALYRA